MTEREHPSATTTGSIRVGQELNLLPVLLVALVFVLLVVPMTGTAQFAGALFRLGFTALLLFGVFAARQLRTLFASALFVVAIAVPLSWVTMFVDHPYIFAASCALDCVFFIAMAVLILSSVIRKHLATVNSIFGAISSYLLLGLAWAALYWGLDRVDNQTFDFSRAPAIIDADESTAQVKELSQFIYFSFVTMSTLGYGDISPQTPLAQTLAWMQSVAGQFYIAVLVAWLVSEIPRRPQKHNQQATT